MRSMSVTVTRPEGPHPTPISANDFRNSQPRAPAPTTKARWFMILPCAVRPMMAVMLSYRLPAGAYSEAGSASWPAGRTSKASK